MTLAQRLSNSLTYSRFFGHVEKPPISRSDVGSITFLGHIDLLRETAGEQIGDLSSEWGRANTVLDAQFGP
jgi:hypothetical protein